MVEAIAMTEEFDKDNRIRKALGANRQSQIMDFLKANPGQKFSVNEISEATKIQANSTRKNLNYLRNKGRVTCHENPEGRALLWMLANSQSQVNASASDSSTMKVKRILVTGKISYEDGFWVLRSEDGSTFHAPYSLLKNPQIGQEISATCEIIPGYGCWKGRVAT